MSLDQLLSKVALALPQSCPADYLDLCQLVLDHAASRRLLQEGCLLPLSVSSACLSLSLYRLQFSLVVTPAFSGCPQVLSHVSFQRGRHLTSFRFSTLDSLVTFLIVNQDPRLNSLCWKHSGFSSLGRTLTDLLSLSRVIFCVL